MAAALNCPECSTALKLKSDPTPGKAVRCPKCDHVFRVPHEEEEAIAEAPRAAKGRSSGRDEERVAVRAAARRPAVAADDDEEDDERPVRRKGKRRDDDEEEEPARSSLPLVLGAAALLLALVGGGLFFFLPRKADPVAQAQGPEPAAVAKEPGPFEPLPIEAPVVVPPAEVPPVDVPPVVVPEPGDGRDRTRRPDGLFKIKAAPPAGFAEWVDGTQGEQPPPLPDGKDRPTLVLDSGGHTSAAFRSLLTPDGRYAVTAGRDKTVRLWDMVTGEPSRVIRMPAGLGHEGALYAAAVSRDSRYLAVAGLSIGQGKEGNLIYLLRIDSGKLVRVYDGHGDAVISLGFSDNGGKLASGSLDRTARVYSVRTGKTLHILPAHGDRIRQVALSPSGNYLATASYDKTARVWDLLGRAKPVVITAHNAKVTAISWSSDGVHLATGGEDGTIRTWTRSGKPRSVTKLSDEPGVDVRPTALAFLPGNKEILYGGSGRLGRAGIIAVDLKAKTGKHRLRFDKHTNTIADAARSLDGKTAITTGGDKNETYVWKTKDGKVVHELAGKGTTVWGVGWASDGKSICWGTKNIDTRGGRAPLQKTMRLDFASGPRPFKPSDDPVRSIVSGGGYRLQQVSDLAVQVSTGGKSFRWASGDKVERITSMTLLPGRSVAAIGTVFTLWLLDLRTGKARRCEGHAGSVTSLAPSADGRYVLTGSDDQTMAVWSPDRLTPLLSMFLSGQDWIAWTPEGYYACSATGERLMGWQVNRGARKLPSYYPASHFRRSLYHPDVLRLILPKGSLAGALLATGKARPGGGGGFSISKVLPPEVAIVTPEESHEQAGGEFEVVAEAKSMGGNAVRSLRLIVDGRPWQGGAGLRPVKSPKAGKVRASWKVALSPGQHVLYVQADSAVSRSVSPPVQATNTAPADTAPPSLYVLAVGVSDYPGDMKLRYAASDASALAKAFHAHHGGVFANVEVNLLADADATRARIAAGLDWLKSKMTARDVGIVFLSGHGTRDPRGKFHFVPVDVDIRDPAGTCVPGDAVKHLMGDLPGRLILMLDSCHSGATADDRGAADDLTRDLVTEEYGVLVMSSSMGNEVSLEASDIKAGFFTKAITDGLSGMADLNRDGTIHLHELDLFTSIRVRQMTGGMQNPVTGRPPSFQTFPVAKRGG